MDDVLFTDIVVAYGPFAVFLLLMLSGFGLALSEEMVIVPAGMFVATGQLGLATTALCAYAGVVISDMLWFAICRHYGTPLLRRRWFKRLVHPRRLLETKHQLERRGVGLIVMARFIPSGRTSAITVAGIFHMPVWKFFIATASCVCITMPIQLGLGYLIGRGIGTEDGAGMLLRLIGLLAVLMVILAVLRAWPRGGLAVRRPRARAAWLRGFRRRKGGIAGSASGAGEDADVDAGADADVDEDADVDARANTGADVDAGADAVTVAVAVNASVVSPDAVRS